MLNLGAGLLAKGVTTRVSQAILQILARICGARSLNRGKVLAVESTQRESLVVLSGSSSAHTQFNKFARLLTRKW